MTMREGCGSTETGFYIVLFWVPTLKEAVSPRGRKEDQTVHMETRRSTGALEGREGGPEGLQPGALP